MVNEKDMEKMQFDCIEFKNEEQHMVTDAEMKGFDSKKDLRKMIAELRYKILDENNVGLTQATEILSERCCMDESTLRKIIAGSMRISRKTVYQIVIGCGMTFDEANKYFEAHEGPLNPRCKADHICICSLRDKDDIYSFVEQYKKYIGRQ